jgi:hypothetical protein
MVFLNVKTGNTGSNQWTAKLMRLCEMQLLISNGLCACARARVCEREREKDRGWCGENERNRVKPVVAYLNLLH